MSQSRNTAWERWSQAIADWLPYSTLTISMFLSQVQPGQAMMERGQTAALVIAAALWVWFMYTRTPKPRRAHSARMAIYFAGLLVLASTLMVRQPVFFVFALTGFFHASELNTKPLALLGVAGTSILINTIITGFPWPTIENWLIFVTIIVVQTAAITFGLVVTEKLAELSEQRRQAVASLEAALEENAELHAQLLTQARDSGVFEERQRLAREIHDTLAQGLVGIITQLEAVEQAGNLPSDGQRHLNNARRLARASLSEARRSVLAYRPAPLEGAHLPDALAQVTQQWTDENGIAVNVTITGEPLPLHPEVEAALLRTSQEALANIAQHAHASRVGLTLSYMGDVVVLDVRDNGTGFQLPDGNGEGRTGFGLTVMRQRVSRVAGTLAIESEPGRGTAISARVPAIVAKPEGVQT